MDIKFNWPISDGRYTTFFQGGTSIALRKKKFPIERALESFDDFYASVYGVRWRNMRVALLTEHKYIALVNNFGDTEQTVKDLENDGAINVRLLQKARQKMLRSDEKEILPKDVTYKLDATVETFASRAKESEIEAIYPPNTLESERVASSLEAIKRTSVDKELRSFDMKKPLQKAMEEDLELDRTRIVDVGSSSGGLYEYVPATRIKGMEDWIPESDHYKYYSTTVDFPVNIKAENDFDFPKYLQLYAYEKGNCSRFIQPKKCVTGVLSHFLMDGASILPPLLLGINEGDTVLDACAAPGGKSLLMLQTLFPNILVSNDVQESRVNRIKNIMNQYVYDFNEKWSTTRCHITQSDARVIDEYEKYDKILVDAPCTTDRHAVTENDNNISKPTRFKERLRIPELQASILTNCIRLLKPGGSLVYSTCTLSPVQNDGVVHMALHKAFTDYGIVVTIRDLSNITQQFSNIFKFENPNGLKFGQMVVPFLPANYGPMYFSKITRNE